MDFFEQVKQYVNENDTFCKANNMTLEVVKLGYAEAVMKVTEHSFNAVHTVQGGALFTLADMAFAGAANSYARQMYRHERGSFVHPSRFGEHPACRGA